MRWYRAAALGCLVLLAGLALAGQPPAGNGAPGTASRAAERTPGPKPADFDTSLPELGTSLEQLPAGPGKQIADTACLECHSSDILRQQRLDAKKWASELTKMMGWGAALAETQKDSLAAYLLQNFGPDNDRFTPAVTRPVGR
jgi:mono/diheme cytochrome c family protein